MLRDSFCTGARNWLQISQFEPCRGLLQSRLRARIVRSCSTRERSGSPGVAARTPGSCRHHPGSSRRHTPDFHRGPPEPKAPQSTRSVRRFLRSPAGPRGLGHPHVGSRHRPHAGAGNIELTRFRADEEVVEGENFQSGCQAASPSVTLRTNKPSAAGICLRACWRRLCRDGPLARAPASNALRLPAPPCADGRRPASPPHSSSRRNSSAWSSESCIAGTSLTSSSAVI